MTETVYHDPASCNYCGGENHIEAICIDVGFVSEAKTVCTDCKKQDYWAYGFFSSGDDGVCEVYESRHAESKVPRAVGDEVMALIGAEGE